MPMSPITTPAEKCVLTSHLLRHQMTVPSTTHEKSRIFSFGKNANSDVEHVRLVLTTTSYVWFEVGVVMSSS